MLLNMIEISLEHNIVLQCFFVDYDIALFVPFRGQSGKQFLFCSGELVFQELLYTSVSQQIRSPSSTSDRTIR